MAQVMVNFRIDESVKKSMEQACREMGLSMTTAFTIFATKVGREKRIPFEVTAEPCGPASPWPSRREEPRGESLLARQKRLEALCAELRRSLTSIHTAIPSSITGLSMERIRLLCGDELKEKAAGIAYAGQNLFSGRNAGALEEKDLRVLDEYLEDLSDIAEDLRDAASVLVPAMKAWSGGDTRIFEEYEWRLSTVSRDLDGLQPVMQRFLRSTARRYGSARALQNRIRQAAEQVETDFVRAALEDLAFLAARSYDALDDSTKARLETHYLQTLERTLQELGQEERSGGDPAGKAALCLRAASVVSQVLSSGGQAQRERDQRSLEAEVTALERLAALRGDAPGTAGPEA